MRRSIEVEGLGHGGAPIPQAALVGPLLISGGISGTDSRTGRIPDAVEDQVALIFENIGLIMASAGGSMDDIARITFSARDRSVRAAIDERWLRAFPDAGSRPARHLVIADIPSVMKVQGEILAVLQGGSL